MYIYIFIYHRVHYIICTKWYLGIMGLAPSCCVLLLLQIFSESFRFYFVQLFCLLIFSLLQSQVMKQGKEVMLLFTDL